MASTSTTTTTTTLTEAEQQEQKIQVDQILHNLNVNLAEKYREAKKEIILEGAKLLETIGYPQHLIAITLGHGLHAVSLRYVYEVLPNEYKYKIAAVRTKTKSYCTSSINDHNNLTEQESKLVEQDSKKVREIYDIKQEEKELEPVHKNLVEKNTILHKQITDLNQIIKTQQIRAIKVSTRYAKKISEMFASEDQRDKIYLIIDGDQLYNVVNHEPTEEELKEVIQIE